MHAEPQKEHQWLQQLVGEWSYEHECDMGPGQAKGKFAGTETVRSLGGLWVLAEGRGEMPGGGTAQTVMTLGYDPQKPGYVGTFIGSMMTYLWHYNGTLDESGRILTLAAEGPKMEPGATGLATYHDIIEIVSPDHRKFRARMLGEDGKWTQFMEADYRRTK